MAIFLKYESIHDGENYYECNSCLKCEIPLSAKCCPNCNEEITEVIDETFVTHNHNKALKALWKNPKNKKLQEEVLEWGVQRLFYESSMLDRALSAMGAQ